MVVASSTDVTAAQGRKRPVAGRRVAVAARELHGRVCRRRGRAVERVLVVGVEGGVAVGAVEDELREGPRGSGGRGQGACRRWRVRVPHGDRFVQRGEPAAVAEEVVAVDSVQQCEEPR